MLSLARPQADQYGNFTGTTYVASQVQTALQAARRTMYFGYMLYDLNMNFKKWLTGVSSGSVTMDTTQAIMRTAQFTWLEDIDINYVSDRVQPYVLLQMPDGYFATFPIGLFLLSTPPRQTDATLVITRQVDGYDLTQILSDQATTDVYDIPAGTNYVTAVQTLLISAGFSSQQMNLTPTSLTLPTDQDFQGGTSYISIINTLLAAINYRNLWFDSSGVAQAIPYVSPTVLAPTFTYQDDSNSVMLPSVNDDLDLFSVPNVWVVTVAETDGTTLASTYTNSNPNSPTSTVNRGRQVVKYMENLNAPTSDTLDSFAQQQAEIDSQIYDTVVYETLIMPFHEAFDALQFNFSTLNISNKFFETGWSITLAAGSTMSHTIQQIVNV